MMIKGFTEVLAMNYNQLLKAAQNDPVKKHFADRRARVAGHLKAAQGLQRTIKH
jgi:hypothetical protein